MRTLSQFEVLAQKKADLRDTKKKMGKEKLLPARQICPSKASGMTAMADFHQLQNPDYINDIVIHQNACELRKLQKQLRTIEKMKEMERKNLQQTQHHFSMMHRFVPETGNKTEFVERQIARIQRKESFEIAGRGSIEVIGKGSSTTPGRGSIEVTGIGSSIAPGKGSSKVTGNQSSMVFGRGNIEVTGNRSSIALGRENVEVARKGNSMIQGKGSNDIHETGNLGIHANRSDGFENVLLKRRKHESDVGNEAFVKKTRNPVRNQKPHLMRGWTLPIIETGNVSPSEGRGNEMVSAKELSALSRIEHAIMGNKNGGYVMQRSRQFQIPDSQHLVKSFNDIGKCNDIFKHGLLLPSNASCNQGPRPFHATQSYTWNNSNDSYAVRNFQRIHKDNWVKERQVSLVPENSKLEFQIEGRTMLPSTHENTCLADLETQDMRIVMCDNKPMLGTRMPQAIRVFSPCLEDVDTRLECSTPPKDDELKLMNNGEKTIRPKMTMLKFLPKSKQACYINNTIDTLQVPEHKITGHLKSERTCRRQIENALDIILPSTFQ